jgi:hypothetical protein
MASNTKIYFFILEFFAERSVEIGPYTIAGAQLIPSASLKVSEI